MNIKELAKNSAENLAIAGELLALFMAADDALARNGLSERFVNEASAKITHAQHRSRANYWQIITGDFPDYAAVQGTCARTLAELAQEAERKIKALA